MGFSLWPKQSDGTVWAGASSGNVLQRRSPLHRHAGCKSDGSVLPTRTAWGKSEIASPLPPDRSSLFPILPRIFFAGIAPPAASSPTTAFGFPVPESDAQANLFELPNGDIWSVNESPSNQRQGMFCRKPDGTYELDEESFRRLSRFDSTAVLSEPDGILWIAGNDGLVRFDRRVKPSGDQSFSVLVRRVSSGSQDIVFGGTSVAGGSATRLPYNRNSLRFEFAAPTYGDENETTLSIPAGRRRQGMVCPG